MDHHTFFHRFRARSDWFYPTLDLDKTETAGGRGVGLFPNGTEVGDIDAILQSGKEDVFSLVGFYLLTVDGKKYVLHP